VTSLAGTGLENLPNLQVVYWWRRDVPLLSS
jgi:hypothetical protein